MFDFYRKKTDVVQAKENDTEIFLSGIDGHALIRDINKHWKTTKITSYMFNKIERTGVSFYKFWAVEVLYMVAEIKNYRNRYTSVRTMNAIKEALLKDTWLKSTLPENTLNKAGRLNFDNLKRLKFTPEPYQMDYFKDYAHRLDQYGLNGDLMAAAAGTGKTFMATAIAEMLDAKYYVVVAPKVAIETVWIPSIPDMYHKTPSTWNSIDSGPYKGERVLLVHYESLDRLLEIADSLGTTGVFIYLDESHHLNTPDTLRTQLFAQLCKATKCRNILEGSGTALKAMGAELIPMYRLIDPLFTDKVEFRFKKIYGKEAKKGLDIIQHRLSISSYKIEKAELALAPPIMRAHPIKIPNGDMFTLDAIKVDAHKFIKERWVYYDKRRKADEAFWARCMDMLHNTQKGGTKEAELKTYLRNLKVVVNAGMVWEIPDELKACTKYEKEVFEKCLPATWVKQFRDVKSVIKYTNLKIQGECLGRILGGKRIEAHVAMVPFVDWVGIVESTEKKTIMFTSFVEALEAAESHTQKLGFKPIVVYGKTSNDLATSVDRFDTDAQLNPLIATFATLSTAVRLTMADTMIMLNSPFRQYIMEQAVSRIYRMGQDSQTYVYQVSLDTGDKPNISTRSADILQWSSDMVEQMMGTKSPFIVGEALEAFEHCQFDEDRALHYQLSKAYEPLGIDIALEQFLMPTPIANKPAYMSW
jgi:superfamily II DNA or RNA helicase